MERKYNIKRKIENRKLKEKYKKIKRRKRMERKSKIKKKKREREI